MQMSKEDLEMLERYIDKYGIVDVLSGVSYICSEKATHAATNWQDIPLAKHWMRLCESIDRTGAKLENP